MNVLVEGGGIEKFIGGGGTEKDVSTVMDMVINNLIQNIAIYRLECFYMYNGFLEIYLLKQTSVI
jgi:hypothetical protein